MTGVVNSVSSCDRISPPTMEMPSGRRSSEPMPVPKASGSAPEQRGHGGHQDRAEAQQAGFADRVVADKLRSWRASVAKSIIMIAFFFTMR